MAEDRAKSPATRWLAWATVLAIGVPLFYILSVGPAIILCEKLPILDEPAAIVYFPMVWVGDHTVLRKPMYAYFNFWVRVAGKL